MTLTMQQVLERVEDIQHIQMHQELSKDESIILLLHVELYRLRNEYLKTLKRFRDEFKRGPFSGLQEAIDQGLEDINNG
jgi:hypothetical protein